MKRHSMARLPSEILIGELMPSLKLWKWDDGWDLWQLISDTGPGRRFVSYLNSNSSNTAWADNYGYTQPSRKRRLAGREYSELCYVLGHFTDPDGEHQIHFDINQEDGNGYNRYARELHDNLYPGDPYVMGEYDRLRLAIWVPENSAPMTTNPQYNGPGCHFKGYLRQSGSAQSANVNFDSNRGQCSGGLYHFFHQLLPGTWQFYIVDTHPTHVVEETGDIAWQDAAKPWRYWSTPNDKPYFDWMTFHFYQNIYELTPNKPLEFYLDDFVLYKDPYSFGEIIEIYSLTGCLDPDNNRCVVSWSIPKAEYFDTGKLNQPAFNCDVRYAFSDIHQLTNKWDDATPAPNGTNLQTPRSTYNCLIYDTTAIDLGANEFIWFGVRATTRTGNNEFVQICLPCTWNGNPPIPGD